MRDERQPPVGVRRRRPRLSDAETERRMLTAAVEMVAAHGLTVSLDHLRLDEVIEAADVARTSAYRRWPYKELFIADLLVELSAASRLGSGWGRAADLLLDALSGLLPRPPGVEPAQDRLDVLVEVLRISAQADVEDVHASPEWRTHIALQATLLGLPDGDLREAVGAGLRRSEARFGAVRADAFRRLADLWGYRPVGFEPDDAASEDRDGFDQLALTLSSTMTGLVIRLTSEPELLAQQWELAPFGTTRRARWSAPALALVQVIVTHLRPEPLDDWGDHHLEAAITELGRLRSAGSTPDD